MHSITLESGTDGAEVSALPGAIREGVHKAGQLPLLPREVLRQLHVADADVDTRVPMGQTT